MYLLPANTAPRSKTKWGGLGSLGAAPVRGALTARSNMIRVLPGIITVPLPPQPGPMPTPRCVPGDVRMENAYWDSKLCRWVPFVRGGPPPTPIVQTNAGTPVPPGFPTNQFFVAPDGSVWEYSSSSGKWFNTGTPYNAGVTPTPPTAPTNGSSAPSSPVSVTVTPGTPAESGYKPILDWLTQQTLITGLPNWIVGGGAALLAWKVFGTTGSKR